MEWGDTFPRYVAKTSLGKHWEPRVKRKKIRGITKGLKKKNGLVEAKGGKKRTSVWTKLHTHEQKIGGGKLWEDGEKRNSDSGKNQNAGVGIKDSKTLGGVPSRATKKWALKESATPRKRFC